MNQLLTKSYETEILDLIDHQSEYSRPDLQRKITALVNGISLDGYRLISELNEQLTKDERIVLLTALHGHRVSLEKMLLYEDDHDELVAVQTYIGVTDRLLQKFAD